MMTLYDMTALLARILTTSDKRGHDCLAPHCANGRRNLLSIGEKSPQNPKAAFLCPSLWHVLKPCLSTMAGCLGSVWRWLHQWAVFDPTQSAAHVVESMTGGYSFKPLEYPQ